MYLGGWVYLFLQANPNELTNGVINAAFMLLFKDSIRLFAAYNEGVINLLGKFPWALMLRAVYSTLWGMGSGFNLSPCSNHKVPEQVPNLKPFYMFPSQKPLMCSTFGFLPMEDYYFPVPVMHNQCWRGVCETLRIYWNVIILRAQLTHLLSIWRTFGCPWVPTFSIIQFYSTESQCWLCVSCGKLMLLLTLLYW